MAHSNNIISVIKLPNGQSYEIHDAQAIHNVEELGLSAALVFKGTKATKSNLPTTDNKVGDVWHVTADDYEYVWTDANVWEELGAPHDFASSSHTHAVTVTGTNAASTVTGSVTIPTVSKSSKYMTATATAGSVSKDTDSVLGAGTTFTVTGGAASTTKIKATATGTAVGANGTASAVTGYAAPTKDSALGVDATFSVSGGTATTSKLVTTTVKNPTVTAVSIPNVTGNSEVTASKVKSAGSKTDGSAASWSASVDNGVLSFSWTANTPTAVTLPTFDTVTATNTTLGTALSASSVTTSNVTVATGSLAANGGGSSVATGVSAISVAVNEADAVNAITDLGTASTATVLTGVKVTSQPTVTIASGASGDVTVATGVSAISVAANTDDTVTALTGVTVGAPTVTLANSGTSSNGVAFVDTVTIGSTSAGIVDGQAAAQKWTQNSGTTGTPQ